MARKTIMMVGLGDLGGLGRLGVGPEGGGRDCCKKGQGSQRGQDSFHGQE